MNLLFVHQNFPGQYLHLVRHLAAQKRHDLVFISEPSHKDIEGVRKVPYRKPDGVPAATHWVAREFEGAARRAEIVATAARQLRDLGFRPDIIIGHHGWGELLNLRDVWPDVPLLGYFEFFYRTAGADVGFDPEFPTNTADFPRIRAKNNTNLQALAMDAHGQTPTRWQLSTYPDWARSRITLLAEGVDLSICRPDPAIRRAPMKIGKSVIAADHRLVTYVARDLEPYRGFHIMMRAVPKILAARPDARVVLVGGDGVSYGAKPKGGTWRQQMLDELGSRIDPDRVIFPGRVDYATHIKLLQRSDAHVYLSYPFVASWSLREAMACGGAIVGSDTTMVREFLGPRRTGLLAPFHDPQAVAAQVLQLLEDKPLARRLGANARKFAEAELDLRDHLKAYEALINHLTGGGLKVRAQAGRKRAATNTSSAKAARTAAAPAAPTGKARTKRKKATSPRARA